MRERVAREREREREIERERERERYGVRVGGKGEWLVGEDAREISESFFTLGHGCMSCLRPVSWYDRAHTK